MPANGSFVVNKTSKFAVFDVKGVTQDAGAASSSSSGAAAAAAGSSTTAAASSGKGKSSNKGTKEVVLEAPPFDVSQLKASECSLEERYELCRSVADECIQEEELKRLLEARAHPICYDGFEPSGRMHIAQGVMRVINVNKLTKAGCHFKFWVADWFAQLNNKMGGDLKKIQTVGKYMIEIWKATGMDMNNVEFLWASEEINRRPAEYWGRVMEVARLNNLSRVQRCGQIMGRAEAGEMSSAQIFYPCMQCADVFFLKADICQLGLDQRKVNMLAREYCDMTKPKIKFKPVILSHHMLAGLKEGQAKMSKSDPDSAIFMEDTAADVKRKIKKAYCPPEVVEGNPVLDYCKHLLFAWSGELTISFREGEPITYTSYDDMEKDFVSGKIHPSELKPAVTDALNAILQPVRDHFAKGDAKKLLDTVRKYKVTR
ncbi:Tyrosine--tRNA ligase [Ectocarpus siliculosus]|uniref:tyrosine--tRNA ligase n=1 Tax=Ectocarpus siliculosus TaxID=2880 RepID=D7FQL3_ECTSI|nr:Tyrosine--tRNA ligase [Ectocarpus siliculosus]|eukprot:CBJ30608.1 Tyrosine--tRNA ligase [Ectocarpus siliculosus]